jgi:hypothetical protein
LFGANICSMFKWHNLSRCCDQKRRRPRKQPDPSAVTHPDWTTLQTDPDSHTQYTHIGDPHSGPPVLYLPNSDWEVLRHTVHSSTLTFIVIASIHTNYQNQTPPSISLYKSSDSTSSHSSSRLVLQHLYSTLPITLRSEASSG